MLKTFAFSRAAAVAPSLEITTDRTHASIASFVRYDRRRGRSQTTAMFTIVVVLVNRAAVPLYLRTGGREPSWRLQLAEGDGWRDAYSPVQPLGYTPPLVLRPGAVYRTCTTVHVEPATLAAIDAAGSCTCRIVYDAYTQWNQGREGWLDEFAGALGDDHAASNTFTLARDSATPRIA